MTIPLFHDAGPGYERVKASALRFVERMKLGEAAWLYRKEPGGSERGSYQVRSLRYSWIACLGTGSSSM